MVCKLCGNRYSLSRNQLLQEYRVVASPCSVQCFCDYLGAKRNGFHKLDLFNDDRILIGADRVVSNDFSHIDRTTGEGFRSGYEMEVAGFFKLHKIRYLYEPCTFVVESSNGRGYYTPDFLLPDYEAMFIEVKGKFGFGAKSKITCFMKAFDYNYVLLPWRLQRDFYQSWRGYLKCRYQS